MKHIFGGLALVLTLGGPVAADPVGFIGMLQITGKAGTGCEYNPTGDDFSARYRPNISGNEDNVGVRLSLFKPRSAHGYRLDQGQFNVGNNSAFKTVSDSISVGGNFWPFDPVPRIRYISQAPATIGAATPFVQITDEIQHFDYMPGCTVKFRLALTNDK